MSSGTFFSGVFGGTGGREGGFSMIYLIFFHYLGISGIRVYLTLSLTIPSCLGQELIQHTSDRSDKGCIFESVCQCGSLKPHPFL